MPFLSKLKPKRGNKAPARSQSRGVEPVRTEGSSTEAAIKISREDFGLFQLGNTRQEDDHVIDIIALHGLDGDWETTWTDENGALWLRDFLPSQLPRARIMSYGYNSKTFFSKAVTDLNDEAAMLLDRLDGERQTNDQRARPIIFVAHSLGGIVVKKALILAHERLSHYASLLSNVRGLVFFGVPHRGSDVAYWGAFAANLLKIMQLGFGTNTRSVKDLERNSATFANISQQFIERGANLPIRTFYETEKLLNQVIVDKDSARLNLPNEIAVGIAGANHKTICKFSHAESQKYLPISRAIKNLVDSVLVDSNTSANSSGQISPPRTACFSVPFERDPKYIDRGAAEQERYLVKLSTAAQAAFNASSKQHKPLCLQGTRVDVLKQISAWADGAHDKCIFWLYGMAGLGKSTIARSVARSFYDEKRLGASFFFSRGGGDTSHARKFFTTMAVQLANKLPALKGHICEAIAENTDIANEALRDQWKQLVRQPLSKLEPKSVPSPLILIIDALDECEGEHDVKLILHLLAEAKTLETVKLRIFVTSRPETPVRLGFSAMHEILHQDLNLYKVPRATVNDDILMFFEDRFKKLRIASDDLGGDWPGKDTINVLVLRADGLFIYAATVCGFLEDGSVQWPLTDLLHLILQEDNATDPSVQNFSDIATTAESPTKELDTLYTQILEHSLKNVKNEKDKQQLARMFQQIVGALVILYSPLTTIAISRLLGIGKELIQKRLSLLRSVLDVPDNDEHPIHLLHPSFRDFLLKEQRCRNQHFWVDKKEAHGALAGSCLRLMSANLKKDICGLRAPGTLVDEMDSSQVEQHLPADLQYACRFWVQHLQTGGARLCDDGREHVFLQEHLLHWLEALSLMRKTSEGLLAITSLESMVTAEESPSLYAFIHDAKRFALYNRSIIEKAPLQVYCSALIFAPETSIIRQRFNEQIPNWIRRLPRVQKGWNSLLQTLEGHSSVVWGVTFSPDAKLVASASDDRTVRLWDPATGAALQTLEGHSDAVNIVAFSPDGKLVASASHDETVRLWDPATGAALQTLEGHSGWVKDVAFSPDGKLVASASDDGTVRLWDLATGAALQTLEGHSGWVIAVAFSPDGKLVASASRDGIVRLWDPATGAVLQTLEGHSDWVNDVTFSPDGKLVASASDDGTVRLWNPVTGAALQTLEGHSESVNDVAFSPDGKLVASASDDGTVRLWDLATGAALQRLEGHSSWVEAVAFSPDGKLVASASGDRTVRLWDSATGMMHSQLETEVEVRQLSFSSDGHYLDTNMGQLHISTLCPSTISLRSLLVRRKEIYVNGSWVCQCLEKVLWLPPEYRATCASVHDGVLVIGHASGRVSIFVFGCS